GPDVLRGGALGVLARGRWPRRDRGRGLRAGGGAPALAPSHPVAPDRERGRTCLQIGTQALRDRVRGEGRRRGPARQRRHGPGHVRLPGGAVDAPLRRSALRARSVRRGEETLRAFAPVTGEQGLGSGWSAARTGGGRV